MLNNKVVILVRIIVIEDEKHLNDILHDYLKDTFENIIVDQVYDGDDALEFLQEHTYDVILLDVMLPHTDGFVIAKTIRETSKTPIIMLSAYSDEDNQIRGYNLGIDEFVKKPYSPKLVMKKIEAIINRYSGNNPLGLSSYGIIKYDLTTYKMYVLDEEVYLNPKEWELFNIFIHNIGVVLSRDTLLNKAWGYDYFGDDRTVDTHIKRLRQKLKSAGDYIKTIYKVGYSFEKQ